MGLADGAAMLEHLELNAWDRLPNERNLPPRESAQEQGFRPQLPPPRKSAQELVRASASASASNRPVPQASSPPLRLRTHPRQSQELLKS